MVELSLLMITSGISTALAQTTGNYYCKFKISSLLWSDPKK